MTDTEETVSSQGAIAEATGAPSVTVHWNDQTWTLPAAGDDVDVVVMQHWEAGRALAFLEGVLGRDQWRTFLKGNRRTTKDAADFVKTIFREGWGVDLGE